MFWNAVLKLALYALEEFLRTRFYSKKKDHTLKRNIGKRRKKTIKTCVGISEKQE